MRTCGDWLDEFLVYFPKERKPMSNCPLTKHNWQMVCIQCGKVKKDGYVRIPFKDFLALKEKEAATQQCYERVSGLAENLTATLRAIRDANYREWEELATPAEFVKWAQSIARAAVSSVFPPDRRAYSGQSQIPQAENQEASGYHWD
jgi:hypothetical protein